MNGRRSLATLGLSLLLHALLVLAIGFFLNQPKRIIQHIEVDLGTTGTAMHSAEKTSAAPAAPVPTPEPPKPKTEPSPEPLPKPVVQQIKQKPKPRTALKRTITAKNKEVEPAETSPDTNQEKMADAFKTSRDAETDNSVGSSTNTPAADTKHSSGQKTEASALQAYLAAVRARIAAAKHYPMMAERRRIQGEVVVSFRLSFDGRLLEEPEVTGSSGFNMLDRAAVRAVKRAAPFPRFPGPKDEMPTEPLSVELDFVIH